MGRDFSSGGHGASGVKRYRGKRPLRLALPPEALTGLPDQTGSPLRGAGNLGGELGHRGDGDQGAEGD
jgi:hypothetical protein